MALLHAAGIFHTSKASSLACPLPGRPPTSPGIGWRAASSLFPRHSDSTPTACGPSFVLSSSIACVCLHRAASAFLPQSELLVVVVTFSFLWLLSPTLPRLARQVTGLMKCRQDIFFYGYRVFPTSPVERNRASLSVLVHTSSPGDHTGKADAWPSCQALAESPRVLRSAGLRKG